MRRLLIVLAAALVAAFVFLPGPLAGSLDARHLGATFRPAFVRWWDAGDAALTPELTRIVGYWFRYHLVKAVTAALLLVVLGLLARRVTAKFRPPIAAFGLVALAAAMANVQGAAAPFASLFPLLSPAERRVPADALRAGSTSPPLDVLLDGYTRYHAVMVVLAVAVAAVSAVASVALWRGFRRWPAVLTALVTVAAVVLAAANTTSTVNPVPGLQGLLDGGW